MGTSIRAGVEMHMHRQRHKSGQTRTCRYVGLGVCGIGLSIVHCTKFEFNVEIDAKTRGVEGWAARTQNIASEPFRIKTESLHSTMIRHSKDAGTTVSFTLVSTSWQAYVKFAHLSQSNYYFHMKPTINC